jgi:uncharacterized tellurite resistance protein B-like protein
MLEDIKHFMSVLIDGAKSQDHFGENDYRVAAAALLIHVATLDRELTEAQRDRLRAISQPNFSLDAARADELIAAGEVAERNSVDFFHFTSVIMSTLNEGGRERVLAMMWQMVLADGHVTEFEENVMWRVADLMGLSTRQRVDLRRQAADNRAASADAHGNA